MAEGRLIAPDVLRQLISYNENTGEAFWRWRDISYFPDERAQKIWNTRFANQKIGRLGSGGYLYVTIFKQVYLLHRVVYAIKHGEYPQTTDHINGDKADNRAVNLRSVTNAENGRNSKRSTRNTSGHVGVGWAKADKRWWAAIKVDYKRIGLGQFKTKEEAIMARRKAEIEYGFHPNHGRAG